MRNLKLAIVAALLAYACPAFAQNEFKTPTSGKTVVGLQIMCQNASAQAVPCGDATTPLQIAGTFSAALGGFTPSLSGARGTPVTVTVADSSGTLPTGTVVDVSNVGSNPMYCNVNGVAATTADKLIASNSWFEFTIPSGVTTLHCIATGGSTAANTVGGSGLGTGAGGGSSGGGGGGNVNLTQILGAAPSLTNPLWVSPATGATFPVSGTFWPYTLGQQVAASSVPIVLTAAQLTTLTPPAAITGFATQTTLASILTNLGAPFQAGGSIGNTTFAATQATAASLNATVVPSSLAAWGLAVSTQNGATPTNAQLAMAQFNTSPTTITTGNVSPLQIDNAGNLLVNIKAGASSGAVAQGSTTSGQTGGLTQAAALSSAPTYSNGTTNPLTTDLSGALRVNVTTALGLAAGSTTSGQTGSMIMGAVTTTAPSYTTAQTNYLSLTTAGATRSDMASVGSTALANYGTSPGAVPAVPVNANATATENHVGEVGSNQISVSIAPTVTASAYSAGNAIGSLQTIAGAARVSGTNGASGTGGILTSLMVTVKTVQSTQVDVFLFNANPSGSTCTDKTAFVLAAADAAKLIGVLSVPGTAANGAGWFSGGTGSLGMPIYYPLTFSLSSATSIFACAVARGAFTPGSTTDVAFNYNFLRD